MHTYNQDPNKEGSSQHLKAILAFEGVPAPVLQKVRKIMAVLEMEQGEVVYLAGDKPHVYLVLSGSVLWQRVNVMRKVVIDVLAEGNVFAVGSREGLGHNQDGFVEALGRSELGVIEREKFFELLSDYPAVALKVVEGLGRRLENVELKIKELSMPNVSDRIVVELRRLSQGEIAHVNAGEWYELEQKLTHEKLASMVGVSRESVTRNLGALRRRGVVDYHRGRYRVKKAAADRLVDY